LLKNSKCSELLQTGQERRPRRCEPNATRFISNRHQEREISKFFRNGKQKKKDVDCIQSVQADVAGSYDRTLMWHVMMWQILTGRQLAYDILTRVLLVANDMMTHGPIRGRHVSLVVWFKSLSLAGVDPTTFR
jgi:hypothetical protein